MQRVCLKSSTSPQRCFFGYRFKQNWPTSILFFLPFYCHHQIYSLRLQTLSTIPCLTFASFSRFSSPNRHPNRMYDVLLTKAKLTFYFCYFLSSALSATNMQLHGDYIFMLKCALCLCQPWRHPKSVFLFVSEEMSLNCKFIIIFLPIKNSVILNCIAKMTYCDNNIVTMTYSEVACGKYFVKQCQNFWKTYVRNSTSVDQLSTSNIFLHMIVSFFF